MPDPARLLPLSFLLHLKSLALSFSAFFSSLREAIAEIGARDRSRTRAGAAVTAAAYDRPTDTYAVIPAAGAVPTARTVPTAAAGTVFAAAAGTVFAAAAGTVPTAAVPAAGTVPTAGTVFAATVAAADRPAPYITGPVIATAVIVAAAVIPAAAVWPADGPAPYIARAPIATAAVISTAAGPSVVISADAVTSAAPAPTVTTIITDPNKATHMI